MSFIPTAADDVTSHLGMIADADRLAAEIDEPLAESAPLAYALAKRDCIAHEPANDCRAYHAIWQYLRLTGVARSVRSDGPLFVAAAQRRARLGRLRRVLVCGTADYSMLAYLGHAARRAGAETRFDVLDRCATALQLNEWYANRVGLRARTIRADVLAFEPDEPYDLICTHSFLAWLDYDMRQRLVESWRDWLRAGGEVAFSNRIDPVDGPSEKQGHSSRLQAMSAEFFQRCVEMELDLPTDQESFRELIRQYGSRALLRRRDMPMETMRGWLDSAGLKLDLAAPIASVVPSSRDRASAPVRQEGRPRVWFLAHRT
jgi:SAM-dependent methyltransferase